MFAVRAPHYGDRMGLFNEIADWFQGAVEDAGNWVEGAIDDATSWLEQALNDAIDFVEMGVDELGGMVDDLEAGIAALQEELANLPANVQQQVEDLIDEMEKLLAEAGQALEDAAAAAGDALGDLAHEIYHQTDDGFHLNLGVIGLDHSREDGLSFSVGIDGVAEVDGHVEIDSDGDWNVSAGVKTPVLEAEATMGVEDGNAFVGARGAVDIDLGVISVEGEGGWMWQQTDGGWRFDAELDGRVGAFGAYVERDRTFGVEVDDGVVSGYYTDEVEVGYRDVTSGRIGGGIEADTEGNVTTGGFVRGEIFDEEGQVGQQLDPDADDKEDQGGQGTQGGSGNQGGQGTQGGGGTGGGQGGSGGRSDPATRVDDPRGDRTARDVFDDRGSSSFDKIASDVEAAPPSDGRLAPDDLEVVGRAEVADGSSARDVFDDARPDGAGVTTNFGSRQASSSGDTPGLRDVAEAGGGEAFEEVKVIYAESRPAAAVTDREALDEIAPARGDRADADRAGEVPADGGDNVFQPIEWAAADEPEVSAAIPDQADDVDGLPTGARAGGGEVSAAIPDQADDVDGLPTGARVGAGEHDGSGDDPVIGSDGPGPAAAVPGVADRLADRLADVLGAEDDDPGIARPAVELPEGIGLAAEHADRGIIDSPIEELEVDQLRGLGDDDVDG